MHERAGTKRRAHGPWGILFQRCARCSERSGGAGGGQGVGGGQRGGPRGPRSHSYSPRPKFARLGKRQRGNSLAEIFTQATMQRFQQVSSLSLTRNRSFLAKLSRKIIQIYIIYTNIRSIGCIYIYILRLEKRYRVETIIFYIFKKSKD